MSHTQYNNYKVQNQEKLRQRYGSNFNDQHVLEDMRKPLSAFAASGSAFGQQTPFVAAQSAPPEGRQSTVR